MENKIAVSELTKLGYPPKNIRKALLKLTGTSQQDVANAVGAARANVARYLDGHRNKRKTLKAIARHFDVPVEDLFPDILNAA